ncbi:MAG: electron transporter RnfB [Candidatus Dactylopiibacterium carminicum]|uniref:Ion-translocating oxidoreductase complex subunit B n=1 Tax=Candidatus Dactylopiibacterium carminicum TaxID=857335 RepID=A0A272EY64_9RHOO|nr:RnfABCDGE type electron transport complex subunit B [Candidatus Dactylopiibacterium carminicum]KAF7600428.1 electron transporter RnfB [Candidatus Dactylopiibacterium carminicum]PAS95049.1 MAG: electron transporter RnfB [Candidatus Dactylopiibacterium carminicum]PAT00427.1 MAG: electron transporter RnfB [Candidatus Dactylopiibacterium carminicum]
MFIAITSLTLLGLILGTLLGIAARVFHVESDSVTAEIVAMMPGTNCGQCGLAGCQAAADALIEGTAPATVCPGGGAALAEAIAARLGIPLGAMEDSGPKVATISEDICIGCSKCAKACATDAILGAAKQIHGVLDEACTGCGGCLDLCPTGAIALQPQAQTLQNWNWAHPLAA